MQYGETEEIMEEPVDREGRKENGEVKRSDVFVVGFAVVNRSRGAICCDSMYYIMMHRAA